VKRVLVSLLLVSVLVGCSSAQLDSPQGFTGPEATAGDAQSALNLLKNDLTNPAALGYHLSKDEASRFVAGVPVQYWGLVGFSPTLTDIWSQMKRSPAVLVPVMLDGKDVASFDLSYADGAWTETAAGSDTDPVMASVRKVQERLGPAAEVRVVDVVGPHRYETTMVIGRQGAELAAALPSTPNKPLAWATVPVVGHVYTGQELTALLEPFASGP